MFHVNDSERGSERGRERERNLIFPSKDAFVIMQYSLKPDAPKITTSKRVFAIFAYVNVVMYCVCPEIIYDSKLRNFCTCQNENPKIEWI